MVRKLITGCLAMAAFAAFALPATASATNDPQLTENGSLVPHPATIVGTNSGETTFTTTAGAGLVHCTSAVMSGTLLQNTGGTVEGEITSAKFSGTGGIHADNGLNECTGSFGNAYITVKTPLCIKSTPLMATDEFQVSGGTCAAPTKVHFTIGSTTAGACTYESTGNVQGDYTTNGSQASLTVRNTSAGSGASRIAPSGILCPSSGALKMTFKLETSNGTPLTIS